MTRSIKEEIESDLLQEEQGDGYDDSEEDEDDEDPWRKSLEEESENTYTEG